MKRLFLALLAAALCLPVVSLAQAPSDADLRRFQEIKGRHDRGEQINAEDRAFAQRIMASRNQSNQKGANKQQNAEWAKAHPPKDSTGLVPLCDLGKGMYQAEQGGLYPGGSNEPPAAHRAAGVALARKIAPIDGKVVLLSVGMSNTTMEFQMFQKVAAADKVLNPNLSIVDGAQGGKTASVTARADAPYWEESDRRLGAAGAKKEQVQVAWIKQANARPSQAFPVEAKKLQADLVATLHNLHARYPNLKIAYLSNRIYGGYATSPLNPEPHAYESGFAVKWLIAEQIAGNPELNYDPAKGEVKSPWIAWGPYLWADGVKPRADGFLWAKSDFVTSDFTHPDTPAREKVAKLLLQFLKTEPTAKSWFLK